MSMNMIKRIFLLCDKGESFELFKSLLLGDAWQVVTIESISSAILDGKPNIQQRANDDDECTAKPSDCLAILNHSIDIDRELPIIEEFRQLGNSILIASTGRQRQSNSADNTDESSASAPASSSSATDGSTRASLNSLVAPFGVQFNADCVLRPNLYGHFHPMEAMLEDFVTNRGLSDAMTRQRQPAAAAPVAKVHSLSSAITSKQLDGSSGGGGGLSSNEPAMRIIYPFGCTLSVKKKESIIMMSSSRWAIPSSRAICAFKRSIGQSGTAIGGEQRVAMIGSSSLMSDSYLDQECNRALVMAIMDFLDHNSAGKQFQINASDARIAEIGGDSGAPASGGGGGGSLTRLLDTPISCLQQLEPLPADRSQLIDRRLFELGGTMIPSIVRAHRDLNVEREPLAPIKAHLESAASLAATLEPATHGFLIRR